MLVTWRKNRGAILPLGMILFVVGAPVACQGLAAGLTENQGNSSGGLSPLRVAAGGRFFETADGRPFFWLADTAWQLLQDLDAEEMERYFADRSAKGFNVVLTVALAELRDDRPNAFGHRPIEPRRPDRPIVHEGPDNDFWDDVERALRLAEKHGIYIALLPTWGKNVCSNWQDGIVDGFFTPESAEAYGKFLGERFGQVGNIIWILGGDRNAPTEAARNIWRAMARGIVLGVTGREDYQAVLMGFHPAGPGSTAWFFNNEPWLDFHGIHSSHGRWVLNWPMVNYAYTMRPVRPVLDLETTYPELRLGWPPSVATDDDARRSAYWAVFAGAAGHTYGHNSIWQMYSPKYPGILSPRQYWYEALDAPSARQMGYLRQLMEKHQFWTCRPDLSLLAFEQENPWEMCLALRGARSSLVYTPTGRELRINLERVGWPRVNAFWFDPRENKTIAIGEALCQGTGEFSPPGSGPGRDWVLVLEGKGDQ